MDKVIGLIHNEPIPPGQPNWESSVDVMAQVEAIEEALSALGHACVRIAFTRDLERFVQTVRDNRVTVAFNLCESVDDDPNFISHPASVLELLGIPFSGSSSAALAASTDKQLGKLILKGAGILTPNSLFYDGAFDSNPEQLRFPVILKPYMQDASIGIDQQSVIPTTELLIQQIDHFYQSYGPTLVEEFISGREFNVSVIGNEHLNIMPIAEIDFSGLPKNLFNIVGYRAKWDPESIEYQETKRVFPALEHNLAEKLGAVAGKCYRLFGLRDYGRVDMRVDGDNNVYVLETNANPCLSPDAGFAAAVLQTGLDYQGMVKQLLELTNSRSV